MARVTLLKINATVNSVNNQTTLEFEHLSFPLFVFLNMDCFV